MSPETAYPSSIPTPVKVLFRSTPVSPNSSSTSHSTPSTPPFTAHTTTTTIAIPVIPVIPIILVVPLIPANMANRYAPLQLPANPGALPQEYQSKITYFDSTGPFTTLQHTKKMQDYFENYEIDNDSVRMRIFVQSLTGDVRTWFRSLAANSITTPDELYQSFTNRWEKKKDPLHILAEYDTIKRGPQETVLEYCARFNNVYNAIPQNLRPPPDLALYKFLDGFDPNMAYQLKERAPQTLADMQNVAVSVEANLIAKRNRARMERRTTFKEEPSAFDQKLDAIINGLQRLGERVENVERKASWEGQQSNTIRNPNLRKTQNTNAGRSNQDHDIRTPFQDNYVEGSTSSETIQDTHMNLMDLKGDHKTFLSKEDQNELDYNQFQTKSGESFDFKQGYDTAVYEVHKQYKLRTRTIDISEPSKTKDGKQPNKSKGKAIATEPADPTVSQPQHVTVEDITDLQPSKDQRLPPFPSEESSYSVPKSPPEIEKLQAIKPHNADKKDQIADSLEEKEKTTIINTKTTLEKPFNLEAEIAKLKISIPLSELAKHDVYR